MVAFILLLALQFQSHAMMLPGDDGRDGPENQLSSYYRLQEDNVNQLLSRLFLPRATSAFDFFTSELPPQEKFQAKSVVMFYQFLAQVPPELQEQFFDIYFYENENHVQDGGKAEFLGRQVDFVVGETETEFKTSAPVMKSRMIYQHFKYLGLANYYLNWQIFNKDPAAWRHYYKALNLISETYLAAISREYLRPYRQDSKALYSEAIALIETPNAQQQIGGYLAVGVESNDETFWGEVARRHPMIEYPSFTDMKDKVLASAKQDATSIMRLDLRAVEQMVERYWTRLLAGKNVTVLREHLLKSLELGDTMTSQLLATWAQNKYGDAGSNMLYNLAKDPKMKNNKEIRNRLARAMVHSSLHSTEACEFKLK